MKLMTRLMAGLVAAMLLLTGCTSGNPDLAATVKGVDIRETTLDKVSASVATLLQADPRQYRVLILEALIQGQVAQQVATQAGVEITDADLQGVFGTSSELSSFYADPDAREVAVAVAQRELVASKLGSAEFTALAQQVPVVLNPRYGTWSATTNSMLGNTGSLSKSVASNP